MSLRLETPISFRAHPQEVVRPDDRELARTILVPPQAHSQNHHFAFIDAGLDPAGAGTVHFAVNFPKCWSVRLRAIRGKCKTSYN
jgi:hypothetical protein